MPRPPLSERRKRPTVDRNVRDRPEAIEEREVVKVFRMYGGDVKKLSQGFRGAQGADGKLHADPRGTRQSPGIPDLEVFFPRAVMFVKWEVKTPDGEKLHQRMLSRRPEEVKGYMVKDYKRAQAQHAYELACRACGVLYGRGGAADALLFLETIGIAKGAP